jgi:hypothetical protein
MSVNDWTLTRAEIILMSLRLIGVLPTGEDTASDFITNQTDEAQNAFNMMLHNLQNETTHPFKQKVFSSPLQASDEVTGSDSLVYTSKKTHTSPNATTWQLSTAYAQGDLIFPTTRGDYYYEAQNAGTSHSVEPTFPDENQSTVTDNDITWKALPDSKPITGAVWTEFWELKGTTGGAYAQNAEYRGISDVLIDSNVMNIHKVWYRDTSDKDRQITLISRDHYYSIYNKSVTGTACYAYYENSFEPKLKLWPSPTDTTDIIMYDATVIPNDMDLGGDTGASTENFLKNWIAFFVYMLAVHLGEEYQIQESKLLRLERKMNGYKKYAIISNRDQVETRYTRGAYSNSYSRSYI